MNEQRFDDEKDPRWLAEHREDVYSQGGEDGVIRQILSVLPERDKWCVEFGAAGGVRWSNSRNLIVNEGYAAVLIEGNAGRFGELARTYEGYANVYPRRAFVGWQPQDGLDHYLEALPIPANFDFLSIDVDGNDYHVWDAVSAYRPKAVCIEFNPTMPTALRYVQPPAPTVTTGSSLASLVELAKTKGYELVSVLDLNAFFVRSEYYPLFGIADNRAEVLRLSDQSVTYLFSGLDGTVHLAGARRLPWHGVELRESRVQHLPRLLRKFPGSYNRLELALFATYMLVRTPSEFRRLAKAWGIRRSLGVVLTGEDRDARGSALSGLLTGGSPKPD